MNAEQISISVNPMLAIGSYSRFLIFITFIVSGSYNEGDVQRKWNNKHKINAHLLNSLFFQVLATYYISNREDPSQQANITAHIGGKKLL